MAAARQTLVRALQSIEQARDVLSAKDGVFLLFAIVSLVPVFVIGTRAESIALYILAAGFFVVFLYVAIPWFTRRFGVGDQISITTALRPAKLPQKQFYAWPYDAKFTGDTELEQLSKFARTAFGLEGGDTMPAEVVRGAVRSGAVIGLRLTTETGRNIGFFDAYHFRADTLTKWIDGRIKEAELTLADFEPIPVSSGEQKRARTIDLAVGAIVVFGSTLDETLAHTFIDMAQDYLESRLLGYDKVTLYATIFSDWGAELARQHKFGPWKYRSARVLPVAQQYDVVARSLKPGRMALKDVYSRQGEKYLYVVEMGRVR